MTPSTGPGVQAPCPSSGLQIQGPDLHSPHLAGAGPSILKVAVRDPGEGSGLSLGATGTPMG